MLAVSWDAPFADPDWFFELKWDGVRCLLVASGGAVTLRSRAGNDMTARYPELGSIRTGRDVVLDGEIVAFDGAGRPSFELLQSRMNVRPDLRTGSPVPVTYVVFDLLRNGRDVIDLPLEERWSQLRDLELDAPVVVADRYPGDPTGMWDFVVANDLEGIVAKRRGSRYQPGVRSPDWRKIPQMHQMRALVGGFTPGEGGRAGTFGSLLLGLRDGSRLRWVGNVGTGFSETSLRAIRAALDEMTTDVTPFASEPGMPRRATWVTPDLVAVVRYKEWTAAGRLRGSSFLGFSDVAAETVTWEGEGPQSAKSKR
jgi:bifunctional non-homologous end joining protein LigD